MVEFPTRAGFGSALDGHLLLRDRCRPAGRARSLLSYRRTAAMVGDGQSAATLRPRSGGAVRSSAHPFRPPAYARHAPRRSGEDGQVERTVGVAARRVRLDEDGVRLAGSPTAVHELISVSARAASSVSGAGWPAVPLLDLELDMAVLSAAGAAAARRTWRAGDRRRSPSVFPKLCRPTARQSATALSDHGQLMPLTCGNSTGGVPQRRGAAAGSRRSGPRRGTGVRPHVSGAGP